MAAGRIKGITIEIGGDTTKLTKALASVDNAISKTQRNLRDLDKALKLDPTNTNLLKDKQRELANEISSTEEKLKTEKEALAQMKNTEGFDANSQAARNLQVQIDLDTAALKQLKEEAKASASVVGTVFQEAGKKIAETGDKIKDVGDKVKNVGSTLTQKVTVPIATAFAGSVKAAIDWESAFTGVMKTVDETANTTYDDLKKSINEIAKTTASSQNEIAGTMEIAGQLGVSADEITDFTKAVVMLKDTTNLTLDEGASAIAKFANVTNMSLSDVDKFGSAIVDLGNNYATTEADILSMATRLAGAGAQIGLSQGEILGFATALSSVGIEAEMGGSAFSKAMIKMQVAAETGYDQVIDLQNKTGMSLRELELLSANNSKDFRELADSLGLTKDEMNATIKAGTNLQDFAKVAHMNTKEFVELYKNDAPAALQAFIQGLGDTEGHGESTIAMLQEMGFTEVRLRDTLTRLANSEDLVVDAVHRGNEAWGENSAMSEEAEKRYATMEAKISQLKARFTEMAVSIGEMLMPYVERLMDFIDQLIEKWNSLDPVQQEMILKIAAIAAAVGPVLIVIGSVISAIGTIVTAVGNVVSIIGNVITAISAISAPVLIVIGVIAALVAAFVHFYRTNEEFRNKVNDVIENVKDNLVQFFNDFKEWLNQALDWLSPILDSVKQYLRATWDFIKELFNLGKRFVSQFLEEHKTEITVTIETIKTIITVGFEVMKAKIQITLELIKGIITTVLNVLTNLLKAATAAMRGDWGSCLEYLKNAAKAAVEGVKNTFINLKNVLSNTFHNIVGAMSNWGREMIDALIDGIRSKIDEVGDAISTVADVIASYIHFSIPDKGPLRSIRSWMPDMTQELVSGIDRSIPQLENAMNNMAGSLVPTLEGVGGNTTTTVNLTVYGAQGQDVKELADIIQQRINAQVYNQRAVFA